MNNINKPRCVNTVIDDRIEKYIKNMFFYIWNFSNQSTKSEQKMGQLRSFLFFTRGQISIIYNPISSYLNPSLFWWGKGLRWYVMGWDVKRCTAHLFFIKLYIVQGWKTTETMKGHFLLYAENSCSLLASASAAKSFQKANLWDLFKVNLHSSLWLQSNKTSSKLGRHLVGKVQIWASLGWKVIWP